MSDEEIADFRSKMDGVTKGEYQDCLWEVGEEVHLHNQRQVYFMSLKKRPKSTSLFLYTNEICLKEIKACIRTFKRHKSL